MASISKWLNLAYLLVVQVWHKNNNNNSWATCPHLSIVSSSLRLYSLPQRLQRNNNNEIGKQSSGGLFASQAGTGIATNKQTNPASSSLTHSLTQAVSQSFIHPPLTRSFICAPAHRATRAFFLPPPVRSFDVSLLIKWLIDYPWLLHWLTDWLAN